MRATERRHLRSCRSVPSSSGRLLWRRGRRIRPGRHCRMRQTHTQGGWSRAKPVPELFLTSARFKGQRAHITKRGESGEMRRLRRISPRCGCGRITADMRLISGDRRRRGACASASARSGLLRDTACSIRPVKKSLCSYCGTAGVLTGGNQTSDRIQTLCFILDSSGCSRAHQIIHPIKK